jgi:hypothetical protein
MHVTSTCTCDIRKDMWHTEKWSGGGHIYKYTRKPPSLDPEPLS